MRQCCVNHERAASGRCATCDLWVARAAARMVVVMPDGKTGRLLSVRGGRAVVIPWPGVYLGCRLDSLRLAEVQP